MHYVSHYATNRRVFNADHSALGAEETLVTSMCAYIFRLKDGREVESRDGVVMTTDDSTYRLVIREARDSDAGVYKCIIRNTAGDTACTATLSVQGLPSALSY